MVVNNYKESLEVAKELKDTIYNLPWYFNLFGIKSKLKRLIKIVYFDMENMIEFKNTKLTTFNNLSEIENYFKNL